MTLSGFHLSRVMVCYFLNVRRNGTCLGSEPRFQGDEEDEANPHLPGGQIEQGIGCNGFAQHLLPLLPLRVGKHCLQLSLKSHPEA
jgi:hypothetical protein